ncbi:MAG: MBL fold metallo-hydrolase [Patescibacteria group bacterium]
MAPKLFFFGGVGTTTGANFLLEQEGHKVLIDCGLLQGVKEANNFNSASFPYDPNKISDLFVTHAHIDHIGRIPKLIKAGFRGTIYSTPETKSISELLLYDAYKIMMNNERKNGEIHDMYGEEDIKKAISMWQTKDYGQVFENGNGWKVVFRDAGHILGSSMVEIEIAGKKIVFTGDLGNSPSLLLKDTETINNADYLVMESVYGDRNHESKEERREKLKKIINEAIRRGGEIVIPTFAVDRAQSILYELNNMVEDGEVPSVPVFLDSPLAEKVAEIYKDSTHLFNDKIQQEIKAGDNIFDFPKLHIIHSYRESTAIQNTSNPKIIIAGSGMSEGGRVLEHEARMLGDSLNTLILVGYQPVGTLGRKLEDGVDNIEIFQNRKAEKIKVRAKIEKVQGYSAHKDSDHLLEFVEEITSPPTPLLELGEGRKTHRLKVFVVLGEPKSSLFLTQRIRDYLDTDAIYPELGKAYLLT